MHDGCTSPKPGMGTHEHMELTILPYMRIRHPLLVL